MKKSIIVLALALLMVGLVFADETTKTATVIKDKTTIGTSGTDESTDVKIKLSLNPKYVFGITKAANKFNDGQNITVKASDSTSVNYEEVKVEKEIEMTPDYTNLVLNSTAANTYYVSYWFYECNEAVSLYAKIDNALIYQKGASETVPDGKKDYIDYQAKITANAGKTNESTATITSNGKDGTTEASKIVSGTKTDELGDVQCGNMEIVLGPRSSSTTDTLKSNIVGNYLSTITLTLKADV